MFYLVFTRRTLQEGENRVCKDTPQPGFSKLYDQTKGLEVCIYQGSHSEVRGAFDQLSNCPDYLVAEVLSGEMDLPKSSVNAWLCKQLARQGIKLFRTPSH